MNAPGFQPYIRREVIAAAVYSLIDAQARKVVDLVTSSRRLRSYADVDPVQMPALFMTQKPEPQNRSTVQGVPPKRQMMFECWLYTCDAQADSVIPLQQLNYMVDAIEAAFTPDPIQGLQTLGGLVANARIEGAIEYYENVTQDGKSIAIIPVAVLIP